MPRRKKVFPCGHKGFGQSCHVCHQEELNRQRLFDEIAAQKEEKQAWLATFAADPIDLTKLPKPIVLKARKIITGLATGESYLEFGGKRLNHNRTVISIPVTHHYRMICKEEDDHIVPKEILSHEDYNVKKPGA